MNKTKSKLSLFVVMLMVLLCPLLFTMNTHAATKSTKVVSKVYCCLYKDGNLVISNKKIKPTKGKKVLENKKVTRPSDLRNITKIKIVTFNDNVKPTDLSWWFNDCFNLKQIKNMKNLDTSAAKSMHAMFQNCGSLKSLDVSKFNTSNVTDMSYMFSGCGTLQKLDVSNFDTSKVKNMTAMFQWLKITSLNLKNFNTKNVKNMSWMFNSCQKLKSLDLSKFDTSKVKTTTYMFSGCHKIKNLNISNFNLSKVSAKKMNMMFYNFSKKGTVFTNKATKDRICKYKKYSKSNYVKHWMYPAVN